MRTALNRLTPATADDVQRLAALPEQIRGYESLKPTRVAEYPVDVERAAAALARLPAEVTAG